MTDKDEEPQSLSANGDQESPVAPSQLPTQVDSNQNLPQLAAQLSPEQQLAKVKRDLESMVIRYAKSESENLTNKSKSEELDKKLKRAMKDADSLANRINILTNDKVQLTDSINAKAAQVAVLEQKNRLLSKAQSGRLQELETEVDQLRRTNEELLKQIETYKCKEGELLDFSERLSMKQVLLQTELDKALAGAPEYKTQFDQLVRENGDLVEKVEGLTKLYQASEESLASERELNEKLRHECEQLEIKRKRSVEELENEMKVLRRKHQMSTKDLLKQLKCLQGSLERPGPQNGNKVLS